MSPSLRRLAVRAFGRRLALSSKPILVGPWRSELGFEGLYWIPFLRWFIRTHGIDPNRLVTLTRGGAAILYGTASIDLYRLRSVDAVRIENQYDWQRTQLQKQVACTAWDRDVLKEAAAQVLGRGESYHVLHPSWMYWALAPFWDEDMGPKYLSLMTDYTPIAKPQRLQTILPAHYVAMKWYERTTFPLQDPEVQRFIRETVSILGAQAKIVVLSGHPATDEHRDPVINHPNILTLPPTAPEDNLAQQIQVLAHADAFVGTYGGVSQLALRLGVPSISVYRQFGGTALAHLHLSDLLSKKTNVPFLCGSLDDAAAWRKALSVPVLKAPEPVMTEAVPV